MCTLTYANYRLASASNWLVQFVVWVKKYNPDLWIQSVNPDNG